MSHKLLRAVVLATAVGLLAAACGSSSSNPTTGAATGSAATGTPIVVGQILPMTGANLALPEIGESLSASIAALNQAGGINGHPLELIQCDSKGDPDTEVQCAQKMIDQHVVATLGDNTFFAEAQVQGMFDAAAIPRIGIQKGDVSEYKSPVDFDFTGGGILILVGMMDELIRRGDTKISITLPDTPQSAQAHLFFDPIAEAQGAKVVNYVLVSSASGDYSQYVTQAQNNDADGIVVALPNAQLVQVAQTINQLDPDIDYVTGIAGYSLDQLEDLGQFAKKASYVSWTPGIDDVADFPGLQEPLDVLTTSMKNASVNSLTALSLMSWMTVHAFSEVMRDQPENPTAASVLAAFKAAKDIPMNDIIPPWTPTDYQSAGTMSALFQNVSNPWVYEVSYDGSATHTSPSQRLNTFEGLDRTTTTTTGG